MKHQDIIVEKACRCLVKCDVMFTEVCGRFLSIPFKHYLSIYKNKWFAICITTSNVSLREGAPPLEPFFLPFCEQCEQVQNFT